MLAHIANCVRIKENVDNNLTRDRLGAALTRVSYGETVNCPHLHVDEHPTSSDSVPKPPPPRLLYNLSHSLQTSERWLNAR